MGALALLGPSLIFLSAFTYWPVLWVVTASLRAGRRRAWRRLRSVVLPLLGPTFGFVVPISLLNALTQVDHVVTMTQGGPSDATNLLLYYIYQQAAQNYDTGLASAATVISVAALLAVTMISFRLIERGCSL
jgi:sn-glycerol 3-phosphate transport system permease protein